MDSVPPLLSFLLMIASGWVHRHQLIVIEFLQAENQLLKKRLRGKRIRFTDAERALLGRKGRAVGRKALMKLDTIVCPDTLFRWHRQFVSQKWNFTHRRGPGRPGIMREISELIVRMAQIARNVIDSQAGALYAKRYLITDRDTKYSAQFRRLIRDNGTKVIRLPPRSLNLNAYAERFVRLIKDECLNRMIFIG
ncbi:MAG TPA: hypothetical protein VN326_08440 [Casimicrobiaceae bacterium]|nr:hypothetical protein [Casimicrobiaceae bacterium]